MKTLDIALGYQRRGFQPIPLNVGSKNPRDSIGKGWPAFRTTEEDLSRHFNGKAQNIGIMLGEPSGGLVDIDLDTLEAIRTAPFFLPRTESIFGRAGSRKSHYLYKTDTPFYEKLNDPVLLAAGKKDEACIVEYRGKAGLQTVFPGSIHGRTGEAIEWCIDGGPASVTTAELKSAVGLVGASALISKLARRNSKRSRDGAEWGLTSQRLYKGANGNFHKSGLYCR